jgi:LGFP repeat-containing protein/peptidase C39-like protein
MKQLTFISALAWIVTGCAGGAPADIDEPEDPITPNWDPSHPSDSTLSNDGQPWRILNVTYEAQTTGYWCGPTATDIALSARIVPPGQAALAQQLHTTTNGTDVIDYVTTALNNNLQHYGWYVTRQLPNDPPTQAQRDLLWSDLVRMIDNGFPMVANIVAPPNNHPPGYPNTTIYHYFTVIGYNPESRQAYIADPANFQGHKQYWLAFDQLATLIPPKGYTALAPCTREAVVGKIAEKYDALGSCSSLLGAPITEERGTPDGVGRYSVFEKGSIYWTPALGAHEVHGRIRDRWAVEGWEVGKLGYPISDEVVDGDGRRSDFQHGSIHWTAATDMTTVTMN